MVLTTVVSPSSSRSSVLPTSSVLPSCPVCVHNGAYYQINETWSEKCVNYTCKQVYNPCYPEQVAAQIVAEKIHCQECPEGSEPYVDPAKCCPVCVPKKNYCKVKNLGEKLLKKGNCTSKKAYPITGCSGMCESSAMATFGQNGYKPMCSCCKPVAFDNFLVSMACSDGTSPYEVKYPVITRCQCSTFTCPSADAAAFDVHTRDTKPKKRSILDELDELDELDQMTKRRRKRRAINLHELGTLADMVRQRRDKMKK